MSIENRKRFWVDKTTGTFADNVVAFGFAELLTRLTRGDVIIHDSGAVFWLEATKPLDEVALERVAQQEQLLTFIETKEAACPAYLSAYSINYDEEKATENNYYIFLRNQTKREAKSAPDDVGQAPRKPHDDLALFKLVNQMIALNAYNQIVQHWYGEEKHWNDRHKHWQFYVGLLAKLFSSYPNDLGAAETAWKQYARDNGISGNVRVTATQILNPTMGKGGDAAKANTAAPGNKGSFWLIELLKIIGAKEAAIPLTVRDSKDRKTYVPVPVKMSFNAHKRIFCELKNQIRANTAVKMDVLAGLCYTQAFLSQWRNGNLTEYNLDNLEPGNFVAGLAVAFYKDMGNAKALLNLTQINLPDWMRVTESNANDYINLIQEHDWIVRFLEEKYSDEYQLLQLYRDFLSGHDLEPFYDFTAGYAHHLMNKLDKGQLVSRFTTNNLEVLIMGHNDQSELNLEELIKTPGFRNLATAIRLSTVVPQQQKARKNQPLYEVRYGLGDEIKRKSAYADELAQALGEFVQSYNQETVQKLERTNQIRRKMVTTTDLDQVLKFIKDSKSAKTVGSLLIAYGYARDPKETDEPNDPNLIAQEETPEDVPTDNSLGNSEDED
jgi:hypothetical protein